MRRCSHQRVLRLYSSVTAGFGVFFVTHPDRSMDMERIRVGAIKRLALIGDHAEKSIYIPSFNLVAVRPETHEWVRFWSQ